MGVGLFFFVGKKPFVQLGVVISFRPRVMIYTFIDRKLWFASPPLQRFDHSLRLLEWYNFIGITMKDPNRFFPHLISI